MGLINEKNRGQKSRDTAPLIQAKTIFIHNNWLGRYNNMKNVETEVWLLTISRIFLANGKRAGYKVQSKNAVAVHKVKTPLHYVLSANETYFICTGEHCL